MQAFFDGKRMKPIPADLLDSDPPRAFRMEYPDGQIMEFEARMRDVSWEPEGSELRLPVTIASTVRYGSIYDHEGAD